jgi:hypothetical protein
MEKKQIALIIDTISDTVDFTDPNLISEHYTGKTITENIFDK